MLSQCMIIIVYMCMCVYVCLILAGYIPSILCNGVYLLVP